MSHLSSPGPQQPQRRSKRSRKESSGHLTVEELLPDDMGYDADIEAVQPDIYEDHESEPDSEYVPPPRRHFHSVDDELAARMKSLGHDYSGCSTPGTPNSLRGRKRRSMHEEIIQSRKGRNAIDSDLEVIELVEKSNPSPPRKKSKKSRPSSSSHFTDASDVKRTRDLRLLTGTSSMSERAVDTAPQDQHDAMDTT